MPIFVLPPWMLALIILFVVLPSFMSMYYRFNLYRHLNDLADKVNRVISKSSPGIQPNIITILEKSFREASQNLEQVNTGALIDQAYSQEKVVGKSCEQIDYFCRILPNLLLAFGLIGTFIGITMNLSSLSQAILQNPDQTKDFIQLVKKLEEPLKGMAIAFSTSLAGLFFSALLTIFNFFYNTNLAKYKLINSLEHYLDNIYYSTLNNQTRLDKIVSGMSNQFKDFLTNFGQTVRDAVESAMRDNIKEITQANVEASQLAQTVYNQLSNVAGTLDRGANNFQTATEAFGNSVQINDKIVVKLEQVVESFEQSQVPQQLSTIATNFGDYQKNFSDSAFGLAQTVKSLENTLTQLQNFTQQLVTTEASFTQLNQSSLQVFKLHQTNQQSLSEMIIQLKEGSQGFELASQTLDQIQKQIVDKSDSFVQVQQDLKTIVETMNGYTNNVNTKIEFLTKVLVKLIRNQENSHQSYTQAIADKLDESIKPNIQYFVEMRYDLSQVIKILQAQDNPTIHSDLSQLIKLLQAQDNKTIHSDLLQVIKLLQEQDNKTIYSDLSQLIKLLEEQSNRTPNKKKFKFWG
ncbi:hypothetical protein [Planktothrix agardhii]|uniref:hypothetical protein n=1 Tax=Planktothrix agardhii TaxID=1160 RepID=UPI00333E4716